MNLLVVGTFTLAGVGKTGLTDVVVNVDQVLRVDPFTRTESITEDPATEGRGGTYFYHLEDANLAVYDYIITFLFP